jgi:hypothetical protein
MNMKYQRNIKIAIGAVIILFLPLIFVRYFINNKETKISDIDEEHLNGRKFSSKVFEYDNKIIFL